jgi:hypothetical protein
VNVCDILSRSFIAAFTSLDAEDGIKMLTEEGWDSVDLFELYARCSAYHKQ